MQQLIGIKFVLTTGLVLEMIMLMPFVGPIGALLPCMPSKGSP